MAISNTGRSVSRRTALTGLGAGGLGLALAASVRQASARDDAADMAGHPMVGTWLSGFTPSSLNVTHWGPDGSMTTNENMVEKTPEGAVVHSSLEMGVWEPVSERGIHFTFTSTHFDSTGTVRGTTTIDGYPVASEDGESFWDDLTQVTITDRDTTGAVTQVLGPGLEGTGLGGVRMRPGKPGYDEMLEMLAAQQAATPESGTPTP
jgi:hypothetical protein